MRKKKVYIKLNAEDKIREKKHSNRIISRLLILAIAKTRKRKEQQQQQMGISTKKEPITIRNDVCHFKFFLEFVVVICWQSILYSDAMSKIF